MAIALSPLAPKAYPELPAIHGVRFATAQAGFRYRERTDLLLVALAEGTQAAGVFTRSKCPSAPVDWCRDVIAKGSARAVVINSGNANAFTGAAGRITVEEVAAKTAALLGCAPGDVLQASTGVIGEPLDPATFDVPLADAARRLAPGPWLDAAKAIMTTDTFPKLASERALIGGVEVTINGIAKGSGMIAPDMATMLAFLFTDAPIAAPVLRKMLAKLTRTSFNAITVDSDTSTSDTLLLFATGAAGARGAPVIASASDKRLAGFKRALAKVMGDLAHQIVRDGEGARHFVSVSVEGAASAASAKRVALAIANSPLVKTAIAGGDANWGRIVAAIGKAGEPADRDKIAIWFGEFRVASAGRRDLAYDEAAVSAYMKRDDIDIKVDLGLGSGSFTVWTCDLTKAYVEINGDYRS